MTRLDIAPLSPHERLDLIARPWDSLDAEAVPLSTAQHAELERRLQTADRDLASSAGWEMLRQEMTIRGA